MEKQQMLVPFQKAIIAVPPLTSQKSHLTSGTTAEEH